MADTFAKVTSNDPAIITAAVYSVLGAVGSATASYTQADGVISVEIGKTTRPPRKPRRSPRSRPRSPRKPIPRPEPWPSRSSLEP